MDDPSQNSNNLRMYNKTCIARGNTIFHVPHIFCGLN